MNFTSYRRRRQRRCLIFLLVFLTNSEVKELAASRCNRALIRDTWRCGVDHRQYKWNSAWKKCYYIVSNGRKWSYADSACKQNGGILFDPGPPGLETLKAGFLELKKNTILWVTYSDPKENGCFVKSNHQTGGCFDINSYKQYWNDGRFDGKGDRHFCTTLGYKRSGKIDDDSCNNGYRALCQYDISQSYQQELEISSLPSTKVYLGDTFTFSIVYKFQRWVDYSVTIEMVNNKQLIHFTESPENYVRGTKYHYPSNNPLAAAGDRVEAGGKPYVFLDGNLSWNERCTAWKVFNVQLVARSDTTEITVRINQNGITSLSKTAYIGLYGGGHHYPTLIQPPGDIFNLGTYTFVCYARLGSDNGASASIGVLNTNYANVDPFIVDALDSWEAEYKYSAKKMINKDGNKPANLNVDARHSDYAYWASGYYQNITFSIGPKIGRFNGRQLFCRSNTWSGRQVGGTPKSNNYTYVDLKVKFLPLKPNMTILWKAAPGKIVAGSQLRVICEAFVGTLVSNPVFQWNTLESNNDISAYEYNHFGGKINHPLMSVKSLPVLSKCKSGTVLKKDDGACLEIVRKSALTLPDAYDYCKGKQHFRLLRIENAKQFHYYLDEVLDGEGFLIDLNDNETEGVYKRMDGTIVDPSQFSYWYERTENDSPYIEDSDVNDNNCVIIRKGGLQRVSCHYPWPFICETEAGYAEGLYMYDLDYGPKFTSILTIDVKDKNWLQGSKLQCGTKKPNGNSAAVSQLRSLGITTVSDWSKKFDYVYEPLVPTIEENYTSNNYELVITLNCTSVVDTEYGGITWIMRQKDGVSRTWIVGVDDEIIERDPHKRITINVEEDTKGLKRSIETGRIISTTMTIDFAMTFQKADVYCYSYNKELPWIHNSTVYGPEQLKDSASLDTKHFEGFHEDMIRSSRSMSKADGEKSNAASIALGGLLAMAVAAGALMLLAKKKNSPKYIAAKEEDAGNAYTFRQD